jgi:hypothetical protein
MTTITRKDIARLRELLSKATPVFNSLDEAKAQALCAMAARTSLPALLDAIERMSEALSFYADPEKYSDYQDHDPGCHPDGGCVGTCGEYLSDADRDGGWRARDARLPEGDDK